MKEFEKYFRAWCEVCRDGQEFGKKGKEVLRRLYNSVPKSINFSRFMDAFLARPTSSVDESTKWMMAWMEKEMRA